MKETCVLNVSVDIIVLGGVCRSTQWLAINIIVENMNPIIFLESIFLIKDISLNNFNGRYN